MRQKVIVLDLNKIKENVCQWFTKLIFPTILKDTQFYVALLENKQLPWGGVGGKLCIFYDYR